MVGFFYKRKGVLQKQGETHNLNKSHADDQRNVFSKCHKVTEIIGMVGVPLHHVPSNKPLASEIWCGEMISLSPKNKDILTLQD